MNNVAGCTRERRRHKEHRVLAPVVVFAWKIRFQSGRTDEPLIVGASIGWRLPGHGVAIKNGNVGSNFGAGQAEAGEISVRLCPFIGDNDGDLCRRRREICQIQLTDNLRELFELDRERLVLTIP